MTTDRRSKERRTIEAIMTDPCRFYSPATCQTEVDCRIPGPDRRVAQRRTGDKDMETLWMMRHNEADRRTPHSSGEAREVARRVWQYCEHGNNKSYHAQGLCTPAPSTPEERELALKGMHVMDALCPNCDDPLSADGCTLSFCKNDHQPERDEYDPTPYMCFDNEAMKDGPMDDSVAASCETTAVTPETIALAEVYEELQRFMYADCGKTQPHLSGISMMSAVRAQERVLASRPPVPAQTEEE